MDQAIAFDTLAYANKLKKAGIPGEQAEVHAAAIAEIVNEQMATKRDIKELETALRHDMKEMDTALRRDMKEMETVLKHEIKEMEMRLTIRMGAMAVVTIGVITTLVKIL